MRSPSSDCVDSTHLASSTSSSGAPQAGLRGAAALESSVVAVLLHRPLSFYCDGVARFLFPLRSAMKMLHDLCHRARPRPADGLERGEAIHDL